jgi:hypothetical protein
LIDIADVFMGLFVREFCKVVCRCFHGVGNRGS